LAIAWINALGTSILSAICRREPPRRGGANEGRRNEAGGAREGNEGAGNVSIAREKARDVVFFSPGLTMASFMEQALVAQLERAEKKRARAVDRRVP
jgi:hypothetical protein